MRKPLLSLLAAAAAAGLAGVADSPARAASMDPFTEQQQTDEALNHAIRLYREGDYAEAEKITRTFLRFNPGSAQAHEVLGAILGRMDRDEEALAEIELSIRMNPAIASAHVNRAVLLVGNGDLDGAREALEAAVELDPKLYGAHARLGRVLRNDPGTGVMRHADAGYAIAKRCAEENGLDLPMVNAQEGK